MQCPLCGINYRCLTMSRVNISLYCQCEGAIVSQCVECVWTGQGHFIPPRLRIIAQGTNKIQNDRIMEIGRDAKYLKSNIKFKTVICMRKQKRIGKQKHWIHATHATVCVGMTCQNAGQRFEVYKYSHPSHKASGNCDMVLWDWTITIYRLERLLD